MNNQSLELYFADIVKLKEDGNRLGVEERAGRCTNNGQKRDVKKVMYAIFVRRDLSP